MYIHVHIYTNKKQLPNAQQHFLTGHALLRDLSIVDFSLHGAITDQPIDVTGLCLSVAIDSADGLRVVARIPRHVHHYDTVGSNQVNAKTTSSECVEGEGGGRAVSK